MSKTMTQVSSRGVLSALMGDAGWRDYYQVTKPKVVMLLLLTALVGACLAVNGLPPAGLLLAAMIGIGLMSSGAAAYNHLLDREIDARMMRTRGRPLVRGQLTAMRCFSFATLISVLGFAVLALWVNMLTAWLTAVSLVGYALIYTLYLKRATPQNIVIGGLAGAAPPLLGWTAMTGNVDPHSLLLVLIVFTWTPPHFWALAIHRRDDYAKVNMPMLPVTHGVAFTKTCILLYTVLLGLVCLLPYLTGMSHELYLLGSSLLNGAFLYYAWRLKFKADSGDAMATFKFSIVHLMLLFIILLTDHYLLA
ncbi:protoheme IX farnesyltransferase [Corallincola spongiicola]|uniref:Protoheme IX farnesyltransferase n=2 Tax=Corallincola spongiicola TaxID=2520508 RepID=A0ABY1WPQ3_9GAMM|nr:heme o synthase [Corallincola spongiicola]TAA46050.1 protoheme IX farnesyltransferase [Corallincola spongiicola]